MRSTTWGAVAAAALLVTGVLATRGGTATAEQDLARLAGPEPSTTSREDQPGEDRQAPGRATVLQADGLPGARLGSTGAGLRTGQEYTADGRPLAPQDLPGGCVRAWSDFADGTVEEYDMSVWLVDDLVSAVVLTRWDPAGAALSGLQTWLGPTLGSPVADASSLPGARTRTERPFGATGPAVTVVHVPGDGVDVVFSDVVQDPRARPEAAAGRITTVEVRHPRARDCSAEALAGAVPGPDGTAPATDLVLGPDGVTVLPLGTAEPAVLARPGALPHGEDRVAGCRSYSFSAASGGRARVVVVDGVVVQGQAVGDVPTTLGVAAGDPVVDVLRTFHRLQDRAGGVLEAEVDDRVVRIETGPVLRWVPEVDVPVRGDEPGVRALAVRTAAVPPARLC